LAEDALFVVDHGFMPSPLPPSPLRTFWAVGAAIDGDNAVVVCGGYNGKRIIDFSQEDDAIVKKVARASMQKL
jgi:hypothetical protein